MRITISFTNEDARRTEYLLRRKYHSKKRLEKLAKLAILTEAAAQAQLELRNSEIVG